MQDANWIRKNIPAWSARWSKPKRKRSGSPWQR